MISFPCLRLFNLCCWIEGRLVNHHWTRFDGWPLKMAAGSNYALRQTDVPPLNFDRVETSSLDFPSSVLCVWTHCRVVCFFQDLLNLGSAVLTLKPAWTLCGVPCTPGAELRPPGRIEVGGVQLPSWRQQERTFSTLIHCTYIYPKLTKTCQ